jgi:hypothetical protein
LCRCDPWFAINLSVGAMATTALSGNLQHVHNACARRMDSRYPLHYAYTAIRVHTRMLATSAYRLYATTWCSPPAAFSSRRWQACTSPYEQSLGPAAPSVRGYPKTLVLVHTRARLLPHDKRQKMNHAAPVIVAGGTIAPPRAHT